jgi:hypothetical protein
MLMTDLADLKERLQAQLAAVADVEAAVERLEALLAREGGGQESACVGAAAGHAAAHGTGAAGKGQCLECGAWFPVVKRGGAPKRYCSTRCRIAYNGRRRVREQTNGSAAEERGVRNRTTEAVKTTETAKSSGDDVRNRTPEPASAPPHASAPAKVACVFCEELFVRSQDGQKYCRKSCKVAAKEARSGKPSVPRADEGERAKCARAGHADPVPDWQRPFFVPVERDVPEAEALQREAVLRPPPLPWEQRELEATRAIIERNKAEGYDNLTWRNTNGPAT